MDDHEQVLGGARARKMRRPRGFTLLELMVATALVTTMLVAYYAFLGAEATTALEESSEINVQSDLRRTLDAIVAELEDARLTYLESLGTSVRYQNLRQGPAGVPVLDAKGNVQWGVNYDGIWYAAGWKELRFVDSDHPADKLIESKLKFTATDAGQNLDRDFAAGTTTQDYGDAFVAGQFQVQAFDVAGNAVGAPWLVPGKVLRQFDPKSATAPPQTVGDNGGFFYMRQPQGQALFNATGGTTPPLVWGPQKSEPFTDTKANGVWDPTESFTDLNRNGVCEEADSEPFTDTNGNNILDGLEAYSDVNGNGKYDAKLKIQLRAFDVQRAVSTSGLARDKAAHIRMLQTKVKIRNGD